MTPKEAIKILQDHIGESAGELRTAKDPRYVDPAEWLECSRSIPPAPHPSTNVQRHPPMRTRLPVCPKCRSGHILIREMTECWAEFEIKDGKVDWDEGNLEPGETAGVWGKCVECEHGWRLKNLVNISKLQDITE